MEVFLRSLFSRSASPKPAGTEIPLTAITKSTELQALRDTTLKRLLVPPVAQHPVSTAAKHVSTKQPTPPSAPAASEQSSQPATAAQEGGVSQHTDARSHEDDAEPEAPSPQNAPNEAWAEFILAYLE